MHSGKKVYKKGYSIKGYKDVFFRVPCFALSPEGIQGTRLVSLEGIKGYNKGLSKKAKAIIPCKGRDTKGIIALKG